VKDSAVNVEQLVMAVLCLGNVRRIEACKGRLVPGFDVGVV